MKKSTFDLYRCSSSEWSKLTWKNALRVRAMKARMAKEYYRKEANKLSIKFGEDYNKLLQLYTDSNKARLFNLETLEES